MTPDTFTPAETRISWHSFEKWKQKQNPCTMPTYYTPAIEELHVGFECEIFMGHKEQDGKPFPMWEKGTVRNGQALDLLAKNLKGLRVKHLDRDDIKSLGWELVEEIPSISNAVFKLNGCRLFIDDDEPSMTSIHGKGQYISIVFFGTLRNKSELARVMKQAGIEQEVKI